MGGVYHASAGSDRFRYAASHRKQEVESKCVPAHCSGFLLRMKCLSLKEQFTQIIKNAVIIYSTSRRWEHR